MLLVITLRDSADTQERRIRLSPEHKAHVAKIADQLSVAGPLVAADGVTMIGSMIVAEFESVEAAEAWLADEPYNRAGVYADISIERFKNFWPQRAGFPPAPAAPIAA